MKGTGLDLKEAAMLADCVMRDNLIFKETSSILRARSTAANRLFPVPDVD